MKILTVGPKLGTPTDGMITLGIHNLFTEAFGQYEHKHVRLLETSDNLAMDCYLDEKFDLIVQLGSPFLWDQMEVSVKWKNVLTIFGTHPEAKKLMMGIGACYVLGFEPLGLPSAVTEFFNGLDLVIVRDRLAKRLLPRAELLPCPAFYSITKGEVRPRGDGATIVWYDPRIGVAACDWQDADKFNAYFHKFQDYVAANNVSEVYYVLEAEHPGDMFGNLVSVIKLETPVDVINLTNRYQRIMSGRVHCAIPPYAVGRDVHLVPVDSRARSLYEFLDVQLDTVKVRYLALLRELFQEYR